MDIGMSRTPGIKANNMLDSLRGSMGNFIQHDRTGGPQLKTRDLRRQPYHKHALFSSEYLSSQATVQDEMSEVSWNTRESSGVCRHAPRK